MKEMWKDIKGYEGLYQVSNLGRVKSLERITEYYKNDILYRRKFNEIIKKQYKKKNGYMTVSLYKDGNTKTYYVHRLVAEHFIPNPEDKRVINHIDFDKTNNRVYNLEWCTQYENIHYSFKNGRHDDKVYQKVKVIYNDGTKEIYPSIVNASENIGCHRDTIYGYWERGYSTRLEELNIKDIKRIA